MNKSDKKLKLKNESVFISRVAIIFLAALVLLNFNSILIFLGNVLAIFVPFLVGIAIAYIWNLILKLLEKHLFPNSDNKWVNKLRRPVSMLLSILVIIGIVIGIMYIVIPQVYESIRVIVYAVPVLAENIKNWFLNATEGVEWAERMRNSIQNLNINWQQLGSQIMNIFSSTIGGVLGSTLGFLGSVVGFFVIFFTAIIFAVYILLNKEKLAKQGRKISSAYGSKNFNKKFYHFLHVLDDTFASFIKGQCLSAISLSALLTISMLIFRMPYAFTIGVVTMLTAFIPIVGAFLGGGVGFLMISVVNFEQALVFLVILVICQQIEGDIIYPKVVGDSVGLPGIWTFAAVVVGGSLYGAFGMILAVPIFATLYKLFEERTDKIIKLKMAKEKRKERKQKLKEKNLENKNEIKK